MNKNPDEYISAFKKEIRQKYDKVAPRYDLMEAIPELLGVKKLWRRENLSRISPSKLNQ